MEVVGRGGEGSSPFLSGLKACTSKVEAHCTNLVQILLGSNSYSKKERRKLTVKESQEGAVAVSDVQKSFSFFLVFF